MCLFRVDGDVFLIGMVSRMTDQKGFDLIAYIMDELLSTERVQFVVAGTGEARYQDMLSYFAGKYPDKIEGTYRLFRGTCPSDLCLL